MTAQIQPDGMDLAGISLTGGGQCRAEAGIVAAEALPGLSALCQMTGENPCPGLNVETRIAEQIFVRADHAILNQAGYICGVNLHDAVIRTDDFPFPAPVMVNGVLVHPAFLNGNGLQRQGIEPIAGCSLFKAPGTGGRTDEKQRKHEQPKGHDVFSREQ